MKRRLLAAAERTVRFLRWWGNELAFCARDGMALIAPKWHRTVTIYVDDGKLVFTDSDSTDLTPILEIPREHLRSELPAKLPDPVPAGMERGRRVRLLIGAQHAFVRRMQLPLAALPHLKTAVALQLPKLLPIDPAQLLIDFEIAAAEPENGVVKIDLAALKRSDLEPIARGIQAWGLRITSLRLTDAIDTGPRFRFKDLGASGGNFAVGRVDRWLLGSAATLGFACASLAATQSYRSQQALDRAQERTGGAASIAMSARRLLVSRLEPLKALSPLENSPSAGGVLAQITALVPSDSWVTTFELKQRNLRLVGISPDPAALVKRLASSVSLTDLELRSSMSLGIGTGKDRFEITAQIKGAAP